jgi:hypothetical protein
MHWVTFYRLINDRAVRPGSTKGVIESFRTRKSCALTESARIELQKLAY